MSDEPLQYCCEASDDVDRIARECAEKLFCQNSAWQNEASLNRQAKCAAVVIREAIDTALASRDAELQRDKERLDFLEKRMLQLCAARKGNT
jgi:hypothetical protein